MRVGRKKRTTGMDMCEGCCAFGCDPMAMSPLFRAKIRRRLQAGLCPQCGVKPKEKYGIKVCKCRGKKGLR